MSGDTLDKMHIALVGEFSRFSREQYAKRIEALGGVICEPCNGIDYIFYGKLPIEQIHEYKYGLDTVFGAYNEIALLDKLTEVEMDKQDRIPLNRIEYYQTLPTQPDGCTVFMYEVRRMAQELGELRNKIESGKLVDNTIEECSAANKTETGGSSNEELSVSEHLVNDEDLKGEIQCLYEALAETTLKSEIKKISLDFCDDYVKVILDAGYGWPRNFKLYYPETTPLADGISMNEISDELKFAIKLERAARDNSCSVSIRTLDDKEVESLPQVKEIKSIGIKEYSATSINTIDEHNKLVRDALRWRGLMASPAIRLFGSAGLKDGDVKKSGYAHFGGEFWTIHSGRVSSSEETVRNRKLITQYADIMAENEARRADQWIMLNIEENLSADAITEVYFEGEELRMTIPANEVVPKNGDLSDQVVILQNAQIAARERGIWQSCTLVMKGK